MSSTLGNGIHGPNTIAAVRDTMFAEAGNANMLYIAEHGTAWGAPYPIRIVDYLMPLEHMEDQEQHLV